MLPPRQIAWQELSNFLRATARVAYLSLKNIEQSLTHREETEAGAGKKYSSNKWLFSQRSKRAFLQAANLGDQLVERLSFRFDFRGPSCERVADC